MPELVEGFTSLAPENALQKRIITEGTGDALQPGVTAVVHYVGTLYPSGKKFDSSRDRGKPFEFKLGARQVILGWDEGVATMRVGEKADFILSPEYGYGSRGAGNAIPGNATLRFEVEVIDYKHQLVKYRLNQAIEEKERGNVHFKAGEWENARITYQKALYYLNDVWEEELEEEARLVRITLLNNLAAVLLKQENYTAVIDQCHEALALDGRHSKALYRLAQAQFALGRYDEASASVDRGLKLSSDTAVFKAMKTRIDQKQAACDADRKEVYAKMFHK
ncbi:hypothetical protein BDF22DRAFT_690197 [Syncephalis plumigaleata]|nr:hypothetical protein BDF22DRAFT_690197 [Syncephalis plumigaleata]